MNRRGFLKSIGKVVAPSVVMAKPTEGKCYPRAKDCYPSDNLFNVLKAHEPDSKLLDIAQNLSEKNDPIQDLPSFPPMYKPILQWRKVGDSGYFTIKAKRICNKLSQ